MDEEIKKPLYSRENLKPDQPLFREPEREPEPELTGEQIDRLHSILDKAGFRTVEYRNGFGTVTPVEPTEQMMEALAKLERGFPVLLLVIRESMELHYEILPKGWLDTWKERGWDGIRGTIRNNVTQMG